MSKIRITESELNRLIAESIEESLENEGLGRWLGNAYQWGRNKLANFKNDFKAARNYQRSKNMNYDPYHYYDNPDNFRNLNGQQYADYRYDLTADRNAQARQYGPSRYKNGGQGQGGYAPNPDLQQMVEPTGNAINPNAPQAPSPAQPGTPNMQQMQMKLTQARQAAKQAGLMPKQVPGKGTQWVKVGPNGQPAQVSYQDQQLIQAIKNANAEINNYRQYHTYNKQTKQWNPSQMQEAVRRIVTRVLNEAINELGDTPLGQKKLGKLSATREREAFDARRKEDEEGFRKNFTTSLSAHMTASRARDDKYKDGDPSKRAMMNAYNSGVKQGMKPSKKKVDENVNEVGDTAKGQYKLGKLSKKRQKEAFQAKQKGDEKGFSKNIERSIAAHKKARDERNEKNPNGLPSKDNYMLNSYGSGFEKGPKKNKKK